MQGSSSNIVRLVNDRCEVLHKITADTTKDSGQKYDEGYLGTFETNGFGMMYDLAAQVPPDDRWAIIAYVRALQLSQDAVIEDVSAKEQKKLWEMDQ